MNPATLVILLVKTSIVTLMVSLGLGLDLNAMALFRHRPWLILRVVFGTCVLVPLVALVVIQLTMGPQLTPGSRLGIALMALSPSAPLTMRKARLQGGDPHLAALLQVAAALVAIVSIPLLADLFRTVFEVDGWDISPQTVAQQVGLVQVLPLSLALLLRRWQPQRAPLWAVPLQKGAFLTMLSAVTIILVLLFPDLLAFATSNLLALLAMVVMTACALAIGWALAGSGPEERLTTALVTSMRNPGLALLFAITFGKGLPGVKLAIVSYLLITILASIPFLRWSKAQRA
jgi:BASS family bile acid:Na+ symporter